MVKNSVYYIFILILFIASNILPQEREKIEVKKNELSDLKDQISRLEEELKQKTEKEKESFEVLENYNKQNYLLRKLIRNLKNQENSKQKEIDKNNLKIQSIEKQISTLKKNYSKYVVAIYKYGEVNELASLLDAQSVEQALVRYKYLQKFSDRRSKDLQIYRDNINELNRIKTRLEKEKLEKKLLADQKQTEENGLEAKQKERKKILNAIRNDKTSLKKELDAKKTAEIKIKQMITKLIADAERKRKEEEKRLTSLNKTPPEKSIPDGNITNVSPAESEYNVDLNTSDFSSFSNLKGKLNWPIQNGKIIRKYGENVNDNLNTVTLNYGVDIRASSDLDVKAVAEGVISAIDWIPGYGSVVIVTHKGDYRTVYSHLSDLYVSEGDKVKTGNVIARVGESLEGNVLHFEIWNSRVNQNPENWLVRK
jgi:septal ring factor EnvC (AmiA/AmiB activator)